MKIKFTPKLKQMASALLVTLVICTIMGLSMASYLMLVAQQNTLSVRSQTWNLAIAYVEAGIEEGLQQLNSNHQNLGADGWSAAGGNVYTRNRTLPGGSYVVTIFFTNSMNPVIIARSTVNVGQLQASRTMPMAFFAQGNGVNQAPTVGRAVRVFASRGALYTKAMVARDTIDMNGNGVSTDSYDSQDPMKSTNGRYDPAKAGDKGDVASNTNIINAVDVGNANIRGHVSTGPGGTVYVGPNGAVGSTTWHENGNSGIEPGWQDDTSNFTFPDTSLPPDYGSYPGLPTGGYVVTGSVASTNSTTLPNPPPSGVTTNTLLQTTKTYPAPGTYIGGVTTNIVTTGPAKNRGTWYIYQGITGYSWGYTAYTTNYFDHVFNVSGSYQAASIAGKKVLIQAPDVILVLPNGLAVTSNEQITIADGGRLTVHFGGTSCSLSGNRVVNINGQPGSLILKAAPSVTSFSLSGNAGFCGVLIGPSINLSMNGGGMIQSISSDRLWSTG
jgi:hypothetical protein